MGQVAGAIPPESSTHFFPALGCCLWGTRGDVSQVGPGAAPALHPGHPGQDAPELGLLELVRACDLSVHLVQLPGKGGHEAGAPGHPGPRGPARAGWAPPGARPWPQPRQEPLRGNGCQEAPHQAHVQGSPCPVGTSRSHGRLPGALPPSRSRPGPERPLPLRSPPPPGAAGHTPACPASAGYRCRGGRGAGTARRALGGRDQGGGC